MLHLITGRSGSGKTYTLITRIKEALSRGGRVYLLVPEMMTYISEAKMLDLLPPSAQTQFEVTNFSSLADEVFRRYGGAAYLTMDNSAKTLLAWEAIREATLDGSKLYRMSKSSDLSFPTLVLKQIEEMNAASLDPREVEALAEKMPSDSILAAKFHELAAIYSFYDASLREKTQTEFPDKLLRLASLLDDRNYFEGAEIFVDSFTSFTSPEYRILTRMIQRAQNVTATLCLDVDDRAVCFDGVRRTYERLQKIAGDVNVETQKTALIENRRTASLPLATLEKNLWNFQYDPDKKIPANDAVTVLSAADPYEECEAVALHILALLQDTKNPYDYADIAIVARDAESYRGILDVALEKYGIPFFFSEKTDVTSCSAARLILSALRAVAHSWRFTDLIALLRTGLLDIPAEDIDLFEIYCQTWDLNGSAFLRDGWSMNPDGYTTNETERGKKILRVANEVRAKLMGGLLRLAEGLHAADNLHEMCRALSQYLAEIGLSARLTALAESEVKAGNVRKAGETLRLYDVISSSLVSMSKMMGSEQLTPDEFCATLQLYFSQAEIASVPAMTDYVTVGSASTLRAEGVKVSFLIGLCEGKFPQSGADPSLFTESEIKTLEEDYGLLLHGNRALRSAEELFFLYRAVTCPSEKLFLFYTTEQGSSPSVAVTQAFRLFKDLNRILFLRPAPVTASDAPETPTENVTNPFAVDPALLRSLLGDHLSLSQSKIESFVSCPYRFYAENVLQLRETAQKSVSSDIMGSFLHKMMENFLRTAMDNNGNFLITSNQPDLIGQKADELLADFLSSIGASITEDANARLTHLFYRLRDIAVMMITKTLEGFEQSSFRPCDFELHITDNPHGNEKAIEPLHFQLKDGKDVHVNGYIDRVDLFKKDGKVYFRIVDYKSSKHTISLENVKSGKDLQLLLYLFTVCQTKKLPEGEGHEAAVSYVYYDQGRIGINGVVNADPEIQTALQSQKFAARSWQFLTEEKFAEVKAEIQAVVSSVAEQIYEGNAEKKPSEKACEFCCVASSCDRCKKKEGGR